MRVFTVHTPPEASPAPDAAPLLLPEGFSWGAFVFGPLWLARHALWLHAAVALGALLLLGLVSPWVALALQVVLGFEAQDLRRRALSREGWAEAGLVAAPDEAQATQRLLDAAA